MWADFPRNKHLKQAIYRGPGGAGDATGDATNASALALAAKNEAQASATSAASSATAAASSATAADTSATTASTAATNASNSASDAATSEANALQYSSDAAASNTDAENHATAAAASSSSAASSASTATTQAGNASTSATNAASSASSASTSASEAAASAASISNRVISVTDNTNAALRITQLGTGNALLVEDSSNPDATPFVIDNSGNVVTGYTTQIPFTYASLPRFEVVGTNQSTSSLATTTFNAVVGASSAVLLGRGRGTVAVPVVVNNNDAIGLLQFEGYDGTTLAPAASITAFVDGTPATNDMPGRLVFSTTADGASTPTERMRIDGAGQVSIGGSPTAGVSVYLRKNVTGGTTAYGLAQNVQIQSDVTSTVGLFNSTFSTAASAFTLTNVNHFATGQGTIGAGSAVTNQYGFSVSSSLTGATNNYGFYGNIAAGTGRYNFYAAGTAVNYFAGNVGVGNTTPTYKVDVTGDVNITGNFYKNGTIFSGGAKGGGSDAVFYENDQTVSTNYTITSGNNAMSAGPITINDGVTVTIPDGSVWSIV